MSAIPDVDYRDRYHKQMDYSIALQRAIEHHCRGVEVPPDIAKGCPYHARKLNEHLRESTGGTGENDG